MDDLSCAAMAPHTNYQQELRARVFEFHAEVSAENAIAFRYEEGRIDVVERLTATHCGTRYRLVAPAEPRRLSAGQRRSMRRRLST
ncbi:hypothetical protein ACQR16_35805 [Bradyrhizobium oligotrophicum]|uniref:hypothetical protein n=1 Tax=Bradyrhizobium oligotrophicum TaxID=44255 RepID=UPI003EBC0D69